MDTAAPTGVFAPPASVVSISSSVINRLAKITYTGGCADQWMQYSSHSSSMGPDYSSIPYNVPVTLTTTSTITSDYYTESPTATTTGITTLISTEMDGAFPIATHSTVLTITDTLASDVYVVTTLGTTTIPETLISTYLNLDLLGALPTPACQLDSDASQCQSAWDAYESSLWSITYILAAETDGRPSCTRATITGDYCSSEVSNFLTPRSEFYTPTVNASIATSTVVPGCTIGCQKCRVTGNSVKVLFWPPETGVSNGSTRWANATGPMTADTLGTTFTSPTVYISFDQLHASDSCSAIGPSFTDKIVAITNSDDLSSIWGVSTRYGGFGALLSSSYSTAPYNYTDLLSTPVPYDIYARQPFCMTTLVSHARGWFPNMIEEESSSGFLCSTTMPYAPILAIPPEVFDLDPAWRACDGDLQGAYDPPTALVAAALALPTDPHAPKTVAASPSPTLASPTPTATGRRSTSSTGAAMSAGRTSARGNTTGRRK